jgi:hypothetical protein
MLAFALRYRRAIDGITAQKALKLRKYELDSDDWQIITDLVSILDVCGLPYLQLPISLTSSQQYKRATLFFSQDSAGIAAVIPAMDRLSSNLNPSTKQTYHKSIIAAMRLARKKLDRYYSLTDRSTAYRIAMGKSVPFFERLITHAV